MFLSYYGGIFYNFIFSHEAMKLLNSGNDEEGSLFKIFMAMDSFFLKALFRRILKTEFYGIENSRFVHLVYKVYLANKQVGEATIHLQKESLSLT